MSQGKRANSTGNALEAFIKHTLERKGYTFVHKNEFESVRYLGQQIYTQQFWIGKGIYESDLKCDFLLYHPEKHPHALAIECKWQQRQGSVDEKFPYLVANIKQCYPCPAVVVIDGKGHKPGSEAWLRKQVDDQKLQHVFSMSEFQTWSNGEEL